MKVFSAVGILKPHDLDTAVPHTYDIEQLPPRTVLAGTALNFQVKSQTLGDTAVCTLTSIWPQPRGAYSFDIATKTFAFTPADDEVVPFKISFQARTASTSLTGDMDITPIPSVPTDFDLVSPATQIPDAKSDYYIAVTETLNPAERLNNIDWQKTRNVEITGVDVLLDEHSQLNNLYDRFFKAPAGDIKTCTIIADRIIVRSPIRVPQGSISLYARELIFEDVPGSSFATVSTTPVDTLAAVGKQANGLPNNGNAGARGGDVHLYVSRITAAGSSPRIVARGATGGASAEGWPGIKGPDMATACVVPCDWADAIPGTVWYDYNSPATNLVWGTKSWPDGGSATAAGKPGVGGNGGQVFSTLSVTCDLSGGDSGPKGTDQRGGDAGTPSLARWSHMEANIQFTHWWKVAEHQTQPGADAPAPLADRPKGDDGTFVQLPDQSSWLHPSILTQIMDYTNDCYLAGYPLMVRSLLQPYQDVVNSHQGPWGDAQGLVDEFIQNWALLTHRVDSNLDFFGHLQNWVPTLSLDVTLRAYQDSILNDVPLLVFTFLLEKAKADNAAKTSFLDKAIAATQQQLANDRQELTKKYQELTTFESEASAVTTQIALLVQALKDKEAELVQKAATDVAAKHELPWWKSALRSLGVICTVFPLAQPVAGGIGEGLDVLSNIDTESPFDSVIKLSHLAGKFTDANLSAAVKNVDDFLTQMDPTNAASVKDYIKRISSIGTSVASAVNQLQQSLASGTAPQSEIETELSRLESSDPGYQQLLSRVRDLNTRKANLFTEIQTAVQEAGILVAEIGRYLQQFQAMTGERNASVGQSDHGAFVLIRSLANAARRRLLKYQYYLAKSYEYRFLQSYPGNYETRQLATKLLTANPMSQTLLEESKTSFQSDVSSTIEGALDAIIATPIEKSQEVPITLALSQLADLNSGKAIDIEIGDVLAQFSDESNRRIVDLKVAVIQGNIQGPGAATTTVKVLIEHEGKSYAFADGKFFLFDHVSAPGDIPFSWGAVWDGSQLFPETPSAELVKLLRDILDIPDRYSDSSIGTFIQPAIGRITVKLEVSDPASNVQLTDLRINLIYSFIRKTSRYATLKVMSVYKPFFTMQPADVNLRGTGIATMLRVFLKGTDIVVSAQEELNGRPFVSWRQANTVIGTSPNLSLRMDTDTNLEAVYA